MDIITGNVKVLTVRSDELQLEGVVVGFFDYSLFLHTDEERRNQLSLEDLYEEHCDDYNSSQNYLKIGRQDQAERKSNFFEGPWTDDSINKHVFYGKIGNEETKRHTGHKQSKYHNGKVQGITQVRNRSDLQPF